ncbi:hypothetical protein [Rickettsiales endosymbiont of Stachyamoeba lipophora]|uniref:hypothetical protein n=1 Tax=Rickettsiales endosymbiont of Stachyamoeba lipophora TaxID=2486578 RepID=UPI000F64FAA6|nr:hypothetical protein [Rickettsiales endosymbiont of Stachyamoeba lipophora]AZL16366.1 hypothetical protein EF513_07495 [Rickettsiales endosymbiont of Stachyamoeba lipophora]
MANIKPLIPESSKYQELYDAGLKKGLTKDEIEYALQKFELEKFDEDGKRITSLTIHPRFDKEDNKQLLIEHYGSKSSIPAEQIDKLSDGRFYLTDGELRFTSLNEVPENHNLFANVACQADRIVKVTKDLTQKYGASYDAALYVVSSITGGFIPTSVAFAKAKLGEEAFGEHIVQGFDFATGKVASAIRQMDPYLSEASTKNMATVVILGTAMTTGMMSDMKFALNTHHTKLLHNKLPEHDAHVSKSTIYNDKIGGNLNKHNFKDKNSFESHYIKHKNEWNNISQEEYINKANSLYYKQSGKEILEFKRANGDILKYNITENEFLVIDNQETIRTFFKPSDGIKY